MDVNKGTLYLIPTVIAEGTENNVIAPEVRAILPHLGYFLAENVRTARRFLSALKIFPSIEALHFSTLDKDVNEQEVKQLMQPIFNGHSIGVLSESGCPGVADPGALAAKYAHAHGIRVVPLVGPSSILLALMGSGLNGQRFAFHGYLPVDQHDLVRSIRELERESKARNQTQIVIETPYRNASLFKNLLSTLHAETLLTIAANLTAVDAKLQTKRVSDWKKHPATLDRIPCVFLFLA